MAGHSVKTGVAIYPGSFDPITNGHVDIIQRLVRIYDELVILVADSTEKQYMFSAEERVNLIEQSLGGIQNVKVDSHNGLTVEYANLVGAQVLIRGLRAVSDFEYEMAMANMNKHLNRDIETLIVFADPKFGYVSSRLMKSVSKYTNQLEGLVPPVVLKAIKQKQNT